MSSKDKQHKQKIKRYTANYKMSVFTAIFLSFLVIAVAGYSNDDRIVGGVDAEPGEFPHQVALLIVDPGRNLQCGGSLITPGLVITAGHCCHGLVQGGITWK